MKDKLKAIYDLNDVIYDFQIWFITFHDVTYDLHDTWFITKIIYDSYAWFMIYVINTYIWFMTYIFSYIWLWLTYVYDLHALIYGLDDIIYDLHEIYNLKLK